MVFIIIIASYFPAKNQRKTKKNYPAFINHKNMQFKSNCSTNFTPNTAFFTTTIFTLIYILIS